MAVGSTKLVLQPLEQKAFAPFGDVIETAGVQPYPINNGTTMRFHDLAKVEASGTNARVLISIFRGDQFNLPLKIVMLERHPYGSQAFIPLQKAPFIVIVAADKDGRPHQPRAYLASPGQGVNYHRNIWHHPLLSLGANCEYAVIDRGGEENNLEEFFFDTAYSVVAE